MPCGKAHVSPEPSRTSDCGLGRRTGCHILHRPQLNLVQTYAWISPNECVEIDVIALKPMHSTE